MILYRISGFYIESANCFNCFNCFGRPKLLESNCFGGPKHPRPRRGRRFESLLRASCVDLRTPIWGLPTACAARGARWDRALRRLGAARRALCAAPRSTRCAVPHVAIAPSPTNDQRPVRRRHSSVRRRHSAVAAINEGGAAQHARSGDAPCWSPTWGLGEGGQMEESGKDNEGTGRARRENGMGS